MDEFFFLYFSMGRLFSSIFMHPACTNYIASDVIGDSRVCIKEFNADNEISDHPDEKYELLEASFTTERDRFVV